MGRIKILRLSSFQFNSTCIIKDPERQGRGDLCFAGLVNPKLVRQSVPNDEETTDTPQSQSGATQITESTKRTTSNMEQSEPSGVPLIRKSLDRYDLSPSAREILMASWRSGTTKQYQTFLDRWKKFCQEHKVDLFNPDLKHPIEFLVSLYKAGLGYSAINTARSALSTILICKDGFKFGEHPLVCRYMKGVFELKPALPRYSEIWDVNIVLDYLKTFKDLRTISLKELTLKLTMLLCLTTGQRCQTIHKINVTCIQELPDRYRITIDEKLKQTKPGRHLKPLELRVFQEDQTICVFHHLKEYLQRTRQHRTHYSQLLLSYIKPFKPISKNTVSRWVKQVLRSSGIDTDKYSAQTTRAASTSHCKAKGLSLQDIMASAGWSNSKTFARFYEKPLDSEQNFGNTILGR